MIHEILPLLKFEMNLTNFELLSVIFYFLIVDSPNRYSQYLGSARPRKESFLSKFQPEPEIRHHEVKDPGGGEGGQLLGLGGRQRRENSIFFYHSQLPHCYFR